ncbi:hypothetical protein GF325_01540 [Candidatus Bathyarchaeota archaeon]|nr:hypothetical protein [Candidatus Bathyarchaeota archaeon]
MKRKHTCILFFPMLFLSCFFFAGKSSGNDFLVEFDEQGSFHSYRIAGGMGENFTFSMNWTDPNTRINMFLFDDNHTVLWQIRTELDNESTRIYSTSYILPHDGEYYVLLYRASPGGSSASIEVGSNMYLDEGIGKFANFYNLSDCAVINGYGEPNGKYALHFDPALIGSSSRDIDIMILDAGGEDATDLSNTYLELLDNLGKSIIEVLGSSGQVRLILNNTDGSEAHVYTTGEDIDLASDFIVISKGDITPGTSFSSGGELPHMVEGFSSILVLMSIAIVSLWYITKLLKIRENGDKE